VRLEVGTKTGSRTLLILGAAALAGQTVATVQFRPASPALPRSLKTLL
jgi:hypothetical protein